MDETKNNEVASSTKPEQAAPPPVPTGSTRTWLIFSSIGVFATIVFGLIYIFLIAPQAPADGVGWSLGWFLFSFGAGLTMIVLPCTLPLAFVIVPLSMGKGMAKGLGMALAFGLGVTVTLSIYGILAALAGDFVLQTLGASLEVVKNWVYFVAGIFALVFAMSEIGLLNIHMPTYSGAAPAFIQKRQEVFKAFLLGMFLGNIGVGCPHPATPLILIEIASSGDILYGWLMFLVHAIGRVLPLLLLSFLAILGVNGLSWLLARKDAVERTTGWIMVFVAGFILTLGLFTHDWWVNSGLHTGLETLTQEAYFNALWNENLGTEVAHLHDFAEGVGLFGQPLWLGNWVLVSLWLIPIWWWYMKRRKQLQTPDGDPCDSKVLGIKRNFLIVISIFLALTFIHFLPQNFYLKSISGVGHHDDHGAGAHDHMEGTSGAAMADGKSLEGVHAMADGTVMNALGETFPGAHVMPDGTFMFADGTTYNPAGANVPPGSTLYSTDISNLPSAVAPQTVELSDGDSYDIVAEYVQKEVGNRTLRMLAYNRSVPGPFIKAPQGAEITINFTNKSDLDQTIHSHGIRLDNNSDGVPGVTQNAVPPGGSHTYTIKFDDEGVYWYHPHTRDDYGQEMGLYGNYLVSPEIPYPGKADREVPLVIDDILIENDRIVDFYKEITNFALLGRFGNEFLVNGQQNYMMPVQPGEVIRFFVTNVSNTRTYNLSIPGIKIKRIGADIGRFERETFEDNLLISPAERLVIEAYFEKSGNYSLTHTMPSGTVELTRFVVAGEPIIPFEESFNTLHTNQEAVDEFATFRSYLNVEPDKRLLLTVQIDGQVDHSMHAGHAHGDNPSTMAAMMSGNRMDKIQWDDEMASDKVNTSENITWKMVDQDTGIESMNIPVSDWTFTEGDLVKIRLTNDMMADHVMQHPIHLHGQQFVVLAENGVPNTNLAWKDTVLVFPGEVVDILVDMSNLGEWMSHCHISEHLHAGMMMQFRVEDENGYATGDEFRATVPAGMNHGGSAAVSTPQEVSEQTFVFDQELIATNYHVVPENTLFKAEKVQDVTVSIFDNQNISQKLSSTHPRPLAITFVRSGGEQTVYTYPGNTAFDSYVAPHGPAGHDNSDGHHNNVPDTPGFDESMPHSHSFLGVNVAYAHGGIDDGHIDGVGQVYTYTMPVAFPEKGFYRAFVEFVPEGGSDPVVMTFNVEVASYGFSIDNFGWSQMTKWSVLLIVSILLMIFLSLYVNRYLNKEV